MFKRKRKVGRPSNKELRRERNFKIFSIIGIFFVLTFSVYSLSGYLRENIDSLKGQVKYGRNGDYIRLDNTDKTGTANNTSTTGNVTGVFDLIGGSFEYTSTFINNSALSANAASLVNSSNHYIKEEITSADLSSIILSNAEKSIFNSSVFNTSYVVYRGLDRQNSNITTPIGGAASDRIGYRVVLSKASTSAG